ncbi:MAG: flavodoxin family protein [Candidatus Delongbacteria bacterium]|nr:flavodoxin family protein [bacterium]MBL7032841.1 flavodoxin family protein [Candidatus Delongbacteria bacterium]
MKPDILIVLGSSRKKGNSAVLAAKVSEGAQAGGATVESVYLNSLRIGPCQGCKRCQDSGSTGCVLNDDMNRLYSLIRVVKAIVIASPVYWFNMSAQTRLFIDRFYAVGVGHNNILGDKQFGLVMTFGGADVFDSGAVNALRSFQDMCRYLGASIAGMVSGTASEPGEIAENERVMEEAYLLGKKLAEYHG